jgi:hypothetical protein
MLTARNAFLSFAMWLGVLQSVLPTHENTGAPSLISIAQLVGFASVLGSLTVLVYRLGVWRQEMENTKHVVMVAAEQRVYGARWQSSVERRLARLEALAGVVVVEPAALGADGAS